MRPAKRCPRCDKLVSKDGNAFWPFCSERCKLIDLGSWIDGRYRIPGEKVSDTYGDEEATDDIDDERD